MATTTTTTVPVTELLSAPGPAVVVEDERHTIGINDGARAEERRVFNAAPTTTTPAGQNSRFLVMSLLVAINIVQV